jgi:hypothetical protein
MESVVLAIKFVMMYGLVILVVAVVGATVIAGLYQLVRDQVRGILSRRGRRVSAPVTARDN